MEDKIYWPGQDYSDREVWLAKRATPRNQIHASLYYDPQKIVAGDAFKGVRQGRFNPGINALKAQAKADPQMRKQLLYLRRKAQQQGHVTIDKNMQGASK